MIVTLGGWTFAGIPANTSERPDIPTFGRFDFTVLRGAPVGEDFAA